MDIWKSSITCLFSRKSYRTRNLPSIRLSFKPRFHKITWISIGKSPYLSKLKSHEILNDTWKSCSIDTLNGFFASLRIGWNACSPTSHTLLAPELSRSKWKTNLWATNPLLTECEVFDWEGGFLHKLARWIWHCADIFAAILLCDIAYKVFYDYIPI